LTILQCHIVAYSANFVGKLCKLNEHFVKFAGDIKMDGSL